MDDNRIRIASYNMHKARGLDQLRRPDRTVQVINVLGADVVLLQQADKRLGDRHPALPRNMIKTETDFELVKICKNGISLGWHGNAVLVRRGLVLNDVGRLDLPGFEPRGAVRMTMGVGAGLTMLATHLGLLRRDRLAQLAVLSDATTGDSHVVMAGDFDQRARATGSAV